MKKILLTLLIFSFLLTACSSSNIDTPNEENINEVVLNTDVAYDTDLKAPPSYGFLDFRNAASNEGFYQLVHVYDTSYVVYNDFASMQQVFLCSSPNCEHNDETCTATNFNNILVSYNNDSLYTMNTKTRDTNPQSTIYKSDLSGSNKEAIFEIDYYIEPLAIGENHLYFIKQDRNTTPYEEQTKEIIALNLNDKTATTLHSFLLTDIRFERYYIEDNLIYIVYDKMPEGFRDINDSDTMFLNPESREFTIDAIDVLTGEVHTVYSETLDENSYSNGVLYDNHYYFYEPYSSDVITKVNISTKEKTTIQDFSMEGAESNLSFIVDGYLSVGYSVNEESSYNRYLNLETGEITDVTLTYHSEEFGGDGFNYSVEVLTDYGDDLLVIYDDSNVSYAQGVYPHTALISKEDYFNNIENYRVFNSSTLDEKFSK